LSYLAQGLLSPRNQRRSDQGMPLIYSPHVPDNLQDTFEGTEVCRAMRDGFAKAPDARWVVECAREHLGWRYFWLFRYPDPKRADVPDKHLHLTLNPDASESAVSIDFAHEGPQRVAVRDRPAREERIDGSHSAA
jgi:hypothetical protein